MIFPLNPVIEPPWTWRRWRPAYGTWREQMELRKGEAEGGNHGLTRQAEKILTSFLVRI